MEKRCAIENCLEKVYFSCSCNKYFCQAHSEKHAAGFGLHELQRMYRAVDRKIKEDLVEQARSKIRVLEELRGKMSERVEKIKNTVDNFFASWKIGVEEQERYLRLMIDNLVNFDIILINESQNISEEIGCSYNVRDFEFFDLEDYLDRLFKGIEIGVFQVKLLNQPISVESKLKLLESQGIFVEGISSMVLCLALSKNDRFLAMGCLDKTIKIWETTTFNQIGVLKGHSSRVLCLSFSPSTNLLASGSRDTSIILWNLKLNLQEDLLTGHTSDVLSLAIKSSFLISSSSDKTILLWNLITKELIHTFTSHKASVTCLSATNNLKTIISGSEDKSLIFWNTFTGGKDEIKIHKSAVKALILSDDEKILFSGSADKTVLVWNPVSRKVLHTLVHGDKVNTLYLTQSYLLVGCKDKMVIVWDLKNWTKEAEYRNHDGQIISVVGFGNGRKIFSSSEDQTVKIFDFGLRMVGEGFSGHCEAVLCVAATRDCRFVATGSRDDTVRLWNCRLKKEECVFEGHLDYVKAVTVTGDNKFVISGSLDNTIKVWNIEEKALALELVGHNSSVSIVTVTDNQEFLVTAGSDRKVIVWNRKDFTCNQVLKKVDELKHFLVDFPELVPYNFYSAFE